MKLHHAPLILVTVVLIMLGADRWVVKALEPPLPPRPIFRVNFILMEANSNPLTACGKLPECPPGRQCYVTRDCEIHIQ